MYSNNAPKQPPRTEESSRNCFTKFLWKPESKDKFISTLSNFDIQNRLKSFSAEHNSSIDEEISQFKQILQSVAELSLVPSRSKTRKKTKKHTNYGTIILADS